MLEVDEPAQSLCPDPRATPIKRGQLAVLINDRYQLHEILGQGGHGIVYRATDFSTRMQVAIKFLHDNVAADPQYTVRMLREAQAMAALAGTSAIQVHELGSTQDGRLFLVMELLVGKDFSDLLAEFEARGSTLPQRALFDYLEPIVDTLEAAHQRGIVHRDLKPSNIFILAPSRGSSVRLLDFGLCKLMTASSALTQDGMIAGSPSYIAPEVWRGNPRILDHRIDVFSLAAIVFRALSGRVPFDAPTLIDKFKQVTSGARPSLYALRPDLHPSIDDWVRQALAVDPNARFQNVRGMWNALRSVVGPTPSLRAPSPRTTVG